MKLYDVMWGRKWGLRYTRCTYIHFLEVEAVCSVKRTSVHFYNMSEIHQAACGRRLLLLQTNHGAEGGRKKTKNKLIAPPDGATSDGTKRPRHESFMGKIIDKRFLTISVALYRVYTTSSPSYFLH